MALVEQTSESAALIQRSFAASGAWRSKVKLVLLDLMVVLLALLVAAMVAPAGPDAGVVVAILLTAWSIFLARGRLYTTRFITRRSDEIRRIMQATVSSLASVAVVAFLLKLDTGRQWLLLSGGLGFLVLSIEREVVRSRYDKMRRSGKLRRRVVMVGQNKESDELAAMFEIERSLGYEVVATIDPKSHRQPKELTTKVLATAHAVQAGSVMIATTAIETTASNRLLRDLMEAGLHVELSSTLNDIDPRRLTVRPLGRYPVVYVEPVHRHGWRVVAKRAFDIVVASLGLLLAGPLAAVLAAAIRLGSEGPVIFKQTRVGQQGNPFELLKFRTMVDDAEDILVQLEGESLDSNGPLFKMKEDPRVTKIGDFLRKTSLDELPQLWNVLRGEMSLVGPRPALYSEMMAWDDDLYGRLRVRPGITGMWQVSGRSQASFEEYTRLDLYYVDNWSLVIDLIIMARTVPAVLKRDGAY